MIDNVWKTEYLAGVFRCTAVQPLALCQISSVIKSMVNSSFEQVER
jgi:hypothetical protein